MNLYNLPIIGQWLVVRTLNEGELAGEALLNRGHSPASVLEYAGKRYLEALNFDDTRDRHYYLGMHERARDAYLAEWDEQQGVDNERA